jgi:xylulose-5-phosphate/fructose-6-phosphate phosphoketolase
VEDKRCFLVEHLLNVGLEGTYSEFFPDKSLDEEGLQRFFKQFSFPGGVGSHCTPETPGSIHEGASWGTACHMRLGPRSTTQTSALS